MMAVAQGPDARQLFDRQLSSTEREVVGLVEAMPADKFNFAPSNGTFTGVRTFGVQAKHISFVMNQVAGALLGETMPAAKDDNGPAGMTSKDDIVKYVKDAFAHAHKAVATVTNQNLLEEIANPFNPKAKTTRVEAVNLFYFHTYDHYGQMVVYLRMNNVIPPASQPRPR